MLKTAQCEIVDTFPAFLSFWEDVHVKPLDTQLELWATEYMPQWPELLEKQQEDYLGQDGGWRAIGKDKVFPYLQERLPSMRKARAVLLTCIDKVYRRAQESLDLDFDVLFMIYVGIGCGAGWATYLGGRSACLFGLENIAECGYTTEKALAGLTAHELGHLLHIQRRKRSGLASGKGPFWQLYREGFAVRSEQIVFGDDSWHEQYSEKDWLAWCTANKAWLATEFLKLVDGGQPVNSFFGSWFSIKGRSGCGHFLGREVIRSLEKVVDFEDIALLPGDEIGRRARMSLERMAGHVV